MNPNRIKPGSRLRLRVLKEAFLWREPAGDVEEPAKRFSEWVPGYIQPWAVLVAGQKATWSRVTPVRWYRIEGDGRWFPLSLSRESELLEWLPDRGPMGALVIDDMSGDDICADA